MSDIIRRDPRAEWIARNRLHPLHAAMQPAQHSWMGPNGLIRKKILTGSVLSAPTASNGLTAAALSRAGRPNARPRLKCNCRCIKWLHLRSTSAWCRTWSAAA